ncbi:hypothetical protein OHA60_06625 [Streptomyces cellulosae]|mgnify:CR=1 FL=1|nr:hypothetical protein OHA60_06625 [Streptomyces cellulosae]
MSDATAPAAPVQLVSLAWLERHATPRPDGSPATFTPGELRMVAARFPVGADPASPDYRAGDWVTGRYLAGARCPEAFPAIWSTDAEGGERYRCRDHGCDCGWTYVYVPGEPMAVPASVREST